MMTRLTRRKRGKEWISEVSWRPSGKSAVRVLRKEGVKKLVAQRHWREAAFKTHKLAEPRVIGTPQDEGNMSVDRMAYRLRQERCLYRNEFEPVCETTKSRWTVTHSAA